MSSDPTKPRAYPKLPELPPEEDLEFVESRTSTLASDSDNPWPNLPGDHPEDDPEDDEFPFERIRPSDFKSTDEYLYFVDPESMLAEMEEEAFDDEFEEEFEEESPYEDYFYDDEEDEWDPADVTPYWDFITPKQEDLDRFWDPDEMSPVQRYWQDKRRRNVWIPRLRERVYEAQEDEKMHMYALSKGISEQEAEDESPYDIIGEEPFRYDVHHAQDTVNLEPWEISEEFPIHFEEPDPAKLKEEHNRWQEAKLTYGLALGASLLRYIDQPLVYMRYNGFGWQWPYLRNYRERRTWLWRYIPMGILALGGYHIQEGNDDLGKRLGLLGSLLIVSRLRPLLDPAVAKPISIYPTIAIGLFGTYHFWKTRHSTFREIPPRELEKLPDYVLEGPGDPGIDYEVPASKSEGEEEFGGE